jgi:Flp pilus assembly protein TadD
MTKVKIKKKSRGKQESLAPKPRLEHLTGQSNEGQEQLRALDLRSALHNEWMLAVVLAVVTAALYSSVLRHPFINYDDMSYIVENDNIHHGLSASTLRWALTSTDESNWHPLTWLSHALDCQLYGMDPAGHHATSLILHLLNSVLLFLLLLRVTGYRWRSLLVAALFALHPLNVESVAWAAERKNVLSMFLLLLTLAAYGWQARKPGVWRYLSVLSLFALGVSAKPMIVTLPFALLLLDYWPLKRIQSWSVPSEQFPVPQRSWQWLVLEKLPLLALSAASCFITIYAQRSSMATVQALPFGQRVANSFYSYTMYLWRAFWPVQLAAFYPHQGARLVVWQTGLCLIFLVTVSLWVWNRRHAQSYLAIGWFWFLGNLVPVIGLVQVGDQGMADRYAYLPLIEVFVMAVWGLSDLFEARHVSARVTAWVGVAVLAALSILTSRQIETWRSSYDLWAHALRVTRDNYLAEDFIGSALLVQGYESSGQRYSDEATIHFQNAVRINPRDAISHMNLGADLHEHGRLEEAIEQYTEALQYTGDRHIITKAYIDLGAAYQQLHDFDKAGQFYRMALALEPRNRALFVNMGKLGMDKRIVELRNLADAKPTAQGYLTLGQLQQAAGYLTEAQDSYQRALKMDPKLGDARDALASIMSQAGR